MRDVWRYFPVMMAVLVLSLSAYAEDLSKEQLFFPFNHSTAGRAKGGSVEGGANQAGRIITVDILYDLPPQESLGGTSAYRQGVVSHDWESLRYYSSPDDLYTLHADWHLGKHIKLGAGYSFNDAPDDLSDMACSSEGMFLYLAGKM